MVCLRHCSVDATKQVPRTVCVFYSPACKEVADTVKDEVMRQNHIEDDATAQKTLHYSSHTQTLTLQKKKGFSLFKKMILSAVRPIQIQSQMWMKKI